MKKLSLTLVACLVALPVAAQIKGPEIDPNPAIPSPQIDLPADTQPGSRRAAGCIKHQVYNTQSVNRYAVAFTVGTSTGDHTFNVEADQIRYIPPSAGLPIATTAETLKWTRFLDTLERAAAARRQVLVDYLLPSREVYGVTVLWEVGCAS